MCISALPGPRPTRPGLINWALAPCVITPAARSPLLLNCIGLYLHAEIAYLRMSAANKLRRDRVCVRCQLAYRLFPRLIGRKYEFSVCCSAAESMSQATGGKWIAFAHLHLINTAALQKIWERALVRPVAGWLCSYFWRRTARELAENIYRCSCCGDQEICRISQEMRLKIGAGD